MDTRRQVLDQIRGRVSRCVGSWLPEEQCLQLALLCSLHDPQDVVEFLFHKGIAARAISCVKELRLTGGAEWAALFGSQAQLVANELDSALLKDPTFKRESDRLATALRCTLAEPDLKQNWNRAWVKAAALFALHVDSYEHTLSSTIGSVVRADSRRLEELKNNIDEDDVDIMFLSSIIVALSKLYMS
jgi:hypothetical protein